MPIKRVVGERDKAAQELDPVEIHNKTTNPVAPGDFTGCTPEFGRCADVARVFGIKRGTLYNLLADGKIRGVLLRVRGRKSGVRLFCMDSIRKLILSQLPA